MTMKSKCLTITLAGLLLALPASAQDLWIGDAAPPLEVTKWIGGDPVDVAAAKDHQVLVLDFWATWCGPCVASMPHMTELAHKYADKGVTVFGVTRPDDNNTLDMVEKFMTDNKNIMGYRSAFDADKKTWDAYMKAAGQNGIPTVFVVDKTGVVAWIGHPMNIDEPLAQIVAGTYDVPRMKIVKSLEKRASDMQRSGDYEQAEQAYMAIAALNPNDPSAYSSLAYMYAFSLEWPGKTRESARRAVEAGADSGSFLASFAGFLAGRTPEYKCQSLALKAAQRAIELVPDDPSAATAMITALAVNDRSDDAKAHALKSIKRFADDATALSRLAGTLQRKPLEYEDLAIKAAKAAHQIDPESSSEMLSLIRILAGAEKTDEAMGYARKAMTVFADDPQSLARLAGALARPELEGRCGALALEAIDAALTAEPEEASHVQTKFRILALCQKDMDAAMATGQYAVEKAGDNAGFLNNFAWSLLTEEGLTGQFNQLALEAAKRCDVQTESGNWMYLDTLALAQFETGAKKEAVESELKAVALAKEKGVAGASLKDLETNLERFRADQGE